MTSQAFVTLLQEAFSHPQVVMQMASHSSMVVPLTVWKMGPKYAVPGQPKNSVPLALRSVYSLSGQWAKKVPGGSSLEDDCLFEMAAPEAEVMAAARTAALVKKCIMVE